MEERRLKFIRQYDQRLTEFLEKEENSEIRKRLEPLFYRKAEQVIVNDEALSKFKETIGKKAGYAKKLINERKSTFVHDPKETVAFLKEFTKQEPLKYLTHSYDGDDFDFDSFIKKCGNQFISLLEKHPNVPVPILYKILRVLLTHDDYQGWGGDGVVIGFMAPGVAAFARTSKKHPYYMELDSPVKDSFGGEIQSFRGIMEKFRREIRFTAETPDLYEWFEQNEARLNLNRVDYEISDSLYDVDFYIDVDQFRHGLTKLIDGMAKRSRAKEVKIDLNDKGAFFELTIDQYGQKIDRPSPDHEKLHPDTVSGDFRGARDRNFKGICDWSFEGTFQDGKIYRINYLDSLGRDAIEEGDFTEGVRHTLRLFK
ncbi:MAG: hypothetical protein KI786_09495 [Mameliella sp.]|nr:hypothetical protein [Phaeodactylibacter sp.]